MLKTMAGLVSAACLALTVACSQTDAGITTKIKAQFAADDTVKAYQIDVTTRNHEVTLSGNVESTAAKEQAMRLARETNGVRSVVDNLRVNESAATTGLGERTEQYGEKIGEKAKEAGHDAAEYGRETAGKVSDTAGDYARKTGIAVEDAAITTAVKTKFLADTTVKGLKIDVDTASGVVTLSGNVGSRAEMDRAMMIARNTEGVKSVVNHLHVGA